METGSAGGLGDPFDFNFFSEDDLINNNNMQAPPNQLNETTGNFSNMETGSAGEPGASFDFNFFGEDDLINNHNMQAPPNQLNETIGNFPNMETGSAAELGAPFDFDFFGEDDLFNNHNMQAPPNQLNETTWNFSNDFVHQSADGGSYQPQLEWVNTNPNVAGHVDITCESIDPSLVNAPNLSHMGTSSVNTPSIDTPHPYLPTMLLGSTSSPLRPSTSLEQRELGSPVESSQSFVNNSSSRLNVLQSLYLGFEGSNPPHGNPTTVQQPRSYFNNPPLPRTSYLYPPTTVNMIPQNGVDQSFHPEHAADLINSNQLNPHYENGLLSQNLLPQRMASLNQGNTVCTDQIIQNLATNNFRNTQQALPYTTSFPQTSMAVGAVNGSPSQINQQQSPMVSHYQSSPYRPLTPSGSQVNQFVSANGFDPQITNSMLLGPSEPQRFQQFTYQPNQVPVAPNIYDPLGCNTMLPDPPASLRSIQQLPHYNQLNQVSAAPDVLDMQFNNSIASMMSRLQQIDNQHLISPVQVMPNVFDRQCSRSMLPEPLMFSGAQQLSDPVQLNQVPVAPNIANLQSDNAMLPGPSMPSRPQTAQGLLNQTAIPNASYPSSGLSQKSPIFNSLAQKEIVELDNGVAASYQWEKSSGKAKQHGLLGSSSDSPVELEELSLPSKRARRDSIMQPQASSSRQVIRTSQSQEDEAENSSKSNPFHLRPVKYGVYDPIFEGIGLPVDPHLRFFLMN